MAEQVAARGRQLTWRAAGSREARSQWLPRLGTKPLARHPPVPAWSRPCHAIPGGTGAPGRRVGTTICAHSRFIPIAHKGGGKVGRTYHSLADRPVALPMGLGTRQLHRPRQSNRRVKPSNSSRPQLLAVASRVSRRAGTNGRAPGGPWPTASLLPPVSRPLVPACSPHGLRPLVGRRCNAVQTPPKRWKQLHPPKKIK